ncbi:hypothetical protein FXB39_18390 [Nocardioides sp. BGMRC 2183]|nr:hypothetical protein FXB39_18390 [Nocardioides sp. BGMRC 2183]
MLVTASTIKDSAANVRFFVEANLASGVGHLVVFLDAPAEDGQAEVERYLTAHPQVTCIRAGGAGWWHGERPANLNHRQRINANWAHDLLAPLGWATWLAHVDGDEVARLDPAALATVPPEVSAVRMRPLEAVARIGVEERSTLFKELLDDADLTLLQVLGLLDEPSNQTYFHGHVMGKSAIRVGAEAGLTLHDAVAPDASRLPAAEDPGFAVLHYDAPTEQEFIRKWTALAAAGPARYRASRQPVAKALKTLIGRDLPPDVRERYLRQIYERTVADDVTTLDELGLLVHCDPLADVSDTPPLTERQVADLEQRAGELREVPKATYLLRDSVKDGAKDGARSGDDQPDEGERRRSRWRR